MEKNKIHFQKILMIITFKNCFIISTPKINLKNKDIKILRLLTGGFVCTCLDEQTIFPDEAETLQRVQQDVGDVLSVCCCPCLILRCGLVGEHHWSQQQAQIQQTGSAIGCRQETFKAVVDRRTVNKLLALSDNTDRNLHQTLDRQWSSFSRTPIQFRCHKERYKR